MVRLLPPRPERADLGLRDVIEAALADGATEPAWIAVDDGDHQWVPLVAACPLTERSRGIVVAHDDRALLTAHRLGVGGAASLPVSTPALIDALESASRGSRASVAIDPGSMELFENAAALKVATFSNRAFWRAQLGDRVLSRLLVELAIGLRIPPAVVPWPALLVAEPGEVQILELWKSLAAGVGRPVGDLVVLEVPPGDRGVAASVYTTLLERAEHLREVKEASIEPVYELPSGRLMGWWTSGPGPNRPGGWVAAPVGVAGATCQWELVDDGPKRTVQDVLDVETILSLDGVAAARVPGSVGGALRRGSPAGLLVQRLAEAADRRGLPLWIPNVDREGLKSALRLPGTLWIDGPAVPR